MIVLEGVETYEYILPSIHNYEGKLEESGWMLSVLLFVH